MKKILLKIFAVLFINAFTSCYDDKSTYSNGSLPDIIIDTTGIPEILRIGSGERLLVQPKVSREGVAESEFSYRWMLNQIAIEYEATGSNYQNYICIGENKDLDTIILLSPSSDTYFLRYEVTDDKSGLTAFILWRILVQNAYNEGLLIGVTYDGLTSDLSLIEGKEFTYDWAEEDKITHNLISNRNGSTINGLFTQMAAAYNTTGTVQAKRLFAIGEDFFTVINGVDYECEGMNYEVFHDKTRDIKPTQVSMAYGAYPFVVVDGYIHLMSMNYADDYPSINIPNDITREVNDETKQLEIKVDKYVAYTHEERDYNNMSRPWGAWYDKDNGMFVYQENYPDIRSTKMSMFEYVDTLDVFDFNNVPGLETVHAESGFNDDFYFLMKNTSTGKYRVYVITREDSRAKTIYDIPDGAIQTATHFVVSKNGNVIYFTNDKSLYRIVLSGASPIVDELYTIPSGEITCFELFMQQTYLREISTSSGILENNLYTLLLGVSEGNTGTLFTIPIQNPGAGLIDMENINTYPGFGRILTIVSQE